MPALVWGLILSYFTLLPSDQLPDNMRALNDLYIHAAIYFFSAFLLVLGFQRFQINRRLSLRQQALILFLCVAYGGLIEILQGTLVPGRAAQWSDFWANALGALLILILLRGAHQVFKKA